MQLPPMYSDRSADTYLQDAMEPLSSPFQTFGHQTDFPDLMDTLHYDDMVPEFAWDESSSVEGLESISGEESLVFNLDQATDLPVMTLK